MTSSPDECFKPTLENFPRGLFSEDALRNGAVAVHFVITFYLFGILALLIQAYIGVYVSKGNLGAATVIGSCAANSLFTVGVVGLLITGPVKLSWYPLWRDNIFYLVAVTILLWSTYNHELKWTECIFLFLVYFVYVLIINFNHKVERGVRRLVLMYRTGDDEQEADQEIEKTPVIGRF